MLATCEWIMSIFVVLLHRDGGAERVTAISSSIGPCPERVLHCHLHRRVNGYDIVTIDALMCVLS